MVVALMSLPSYITRHRQSYILQRAVPRSLQQALGRRVWKVAAGMTLRDAQSRLPGFLEATDREIAIARGELALTADEQINRLTDIDTTDAQLVETYRYGIEIDQSLTQDQRERANSVLDGTPPDAFTAANLIDIATSLKSPAQRTRQSWIKELNQFLAYCNTHSPIYCTKQQAIDYRTELLSRMAPNSVKTKLAFLTGLWSILEEVKGSEHIFRGLTKRIKVIKQQKDYSCTAPDEWKPSKWNDIYLILHYTGARLAEIAGLTYEDIKEDRIIIQPHPHRPLKTQASRREVPLHPQLVSTVSKYLDRGSGELSPPGGIIFPELESNGRWGTNLSKPCTTITGLNPHGHRHLAATTLRDNGYNETVIGRLLGHTPNTITGNYGSVSWEKLVEAVNSLT